MPEYPDNTAHPLRTVPYLSNIGNTITLGRRERQTQLSERKLRRKGNISEDGESIRSKCEVSYSI
ncbi:hypothetical protein T11_5080 [Trichinella zimbabwensis]|uniref:Uncharacterized protein n=1 Tax=Trichinella zimbabwensis TaxID=268475 RepID=A0A0V1HTI9_9BILA|nr:hypothetical protein T11_5080 [Trichinella zimbabwensis]